MSDITRIQFELTTERLKALEALMIEIDVKTKKDLINNALSLLKWTIKEIKTGRIIASVDEKNEKYKELNMPIFSAIQTNNTGQ